MKLRRLFLLLLPVLGVAGPARAEVGEPLRSVVSAELPGRSISALVMQQAGAGPFSRLVLLFPGHPGIMKIRSADKFDLGANFLIRSAPLWLDRNTVVAAVDAPSDQWCCFNGAFRASSRYAEELVALNARLSERFGSIPRVIVGTGEGSVSAYHAALALGRSASQVIFTASLFDSSPSSRGLAAMDMRRIQRPVLWVHHRNDACGPTPYWKAERVAGRSEAPLITVLGGSSEDDDGCQPLSAHGFAGVEQATVAAVKQWLDSGLVRDVGLLTPEQEPAQGAAQLAGLEDNPAVSPRQK